MTARIKIVLFLSIISGLINAQDISLQASLDRDSMLIGEQVGFSLKIRSSSSLHSIVPLDDNLFPGRIEVLDKKQDSTHVDGTHIYSNDYLITSFDSGVYRLNMVPVLVNANQKLDTLYTPPLQLEVYSPPVDTAAAIKDIKDPVGTPFRLSELLPYAPYAGGLAVLILAGILLYLYSKRKQRGPGTLVPELPPHLKALEALDRIKAEKLWQQGKVKEYYSHLSDTVRIYIEEQYNIPAMESVTWEILQAFKRFSWDDDNLMEILESLLQLSDLVKFAKEDPTPSENEMNLNNAYIFIEKTKPVEKPEKELVDQE